MKKVGISLGNVCFSAHWGKLNGLFVKKCPFDQMISNYDGVVKCILDDFANFTNIQHLKKGHSLSNTYYNFSYNHEFIHPDHDKVLLHKKENWPEGPFHFVNNNYKHFISRYNERIKNFKDLLLDKNNFIIFIFQDTRQELTDPNLLKLKNALKLKYPQLKYEIKFLSPDKKSHKTIAGEPVAVPVIKPINKKRIGISLGNVCNSAVYGIQNGLRGDKLSGYNTCPFDLMISNYKGICKCIEDDFLHFCDPKHLIKRKILYNNYYDFFFNHEYNPEKKLHEKQKWPGGVEHFVKNNFKNFKERYSKRIENFKNYLKNPNYFIVFIIQFKKEDQPNKDLKELRDILKKKYPNLQYEFKIIPPKLQLTPDL
jgi:hypothetical protein